MFSFRDIKARLASLGVQLQRSNWGQFRLSMMGAAASTTERLVDNLEDALLTGLSMSRNIRV